MPLLVDACSMKLLQVANKPPVYVMQTLFGGGRMACLFLCLAKPCVYDVQLLGSC